MGIVVLRLRRSVAAGRQTWLRDLLQSGTRAHLRLGVVAGLLAAAVSIAANLRRGDPHGLSTAPDILSALIVGLVVWLAVRHAALQHRAHAQVAAHRTALAASITFAVAMTGFSWWYFNHGSLMMFAFASGTAFGLAYLFGVVATRVAAKRAV